MNMQPEAISLIGKPLYAESLRTDAAKTAAADAECESAWNVYRESRDAASLAKLAAKLRAAGRYLEAVAALTEGLAKEPRNGDLLAERGHTYVNMRATALAEADLELAIKYAPESFDAWYHLGLARYLRADFGGAAQAYLRAADVSPGDSNRLAASVWHYTALARAGRLQEAKEFLPKIDWDVDLEGRNYNYQLRARFYQGSLSEQELVDSQEAGTKSEGSLGFGLGIHYLVHGEPERARAHFETAAASSFWPAFGVSASELELGIFDGIAAPEHEAVSLLGDPLYSELAHSPEEVAAKEAELEKTGRDLAAAPHDVSLIRAHAKVLGSGLARYRAAQSVLDAGLQRHPGDPMLLCDKGHYYVNMREFDRALENLDSAVAQVDDSHDIWYHKALAHWMLHDFESALTAFRRALELTDHDSQRAAFSDWLYMTLRRLGRDQEAEEVLVPIRADMEMTGNNHLYLTRLLFYRGDITKEQAEEEFSRGGLAHASYFGLGCWHLYNDQPERAREYFRKVVFQGTSWGGFAHVAAEVELARGDL